MDGTGNVNVPGSLGVGGTPSAALHVQRAAANAVARISSVGGGGRDWNLTSYPSGAFSIGSDLTVDQFVVQAGNIVQAGAAPFNAINGTTAATFGFKLQSSATDTAVFTYNAVTGENKIGGVQSYVFPTLWAGGSERLRIDTSGNLGVGMTPTTKVDIAVTSGMLRLGGSSGNNLIQAYSSGGTLGLWAGGGSQIYSNGALVFLVGATTGTSNPTGGTQAMQISSGGVITDATTNELGWKDIPANSQSSAYTLVLADRGKQILITTGGVTVPQSVFSVGNVVSVVNNSGTAQTITQGTGVTVHKAGTTTTGNLTLAAWGIATVLCIGSSVFLVSGNVT
jgi:hypothetical protein